MKNKYIFAPYIMENSIDSVRVSDILRITHLNISFAIIVDGEVSVKHLNYLDRISIYKKINPELKVVLSIGGWGADGFSQAAKTKEGREKFAQTAMKIVTDWDFDGVDIDWEYPCSEQAGIAYADYDKENFTFLLQELRNSLDNLKTGKKYILTSAVGGGEYFVKGTEMEKVSQILDYVNLMTYDLRGGFTNITGHHANLGPQTGDEEGLSSMKTVEIFHKAGVPYEKMILGAAFYGRKWDNVLSTENNGLGQEADAFGNYSAGFSELKADFIDKNGFVRYFDEQAKAPYLFNGKCFITYEDEQSVKAKCDFIKEKGLAGIMYWSYGSSELFEVISNNLNNGLNV